MTEAEWQTETDPGRMLKSLRGKAPARKLWSFVAAASAQAVAFDPSDWFGWWGTIGELLATKEPGPEEHQAVRAVVREWIERLVNENDFERAAYVRDFELQLNNPDWMVAVSMRQADGLASLTPPRDLRVAPSPEPRRLRRAERAALLGEYRRSLADLLRCIFPDPSRPAPALDPAWFTWNGGTISKLARATHDARACDCLPLLADALEDAGCTDAALLGHCRSGGEHARGCWAVDLLLDKD